MSHRHIYKNLLEHLVSGLYSQCNFCDDSQGTQTHHGTVRKFSPSFSLESSTTDPSAITISKPLTAERKISIFHTGTMGGSSDTSGNRYMRQGCQVVQRISLSVKPGTSSPYFMPPSTVTVFCTGSSDKILFRLLDEIRLYLLSAMVLKQ